MGPDAKCFEEGYDYCDNETYIYIVNINEPDVCADENHTNYYYKDENGNKFKVGNCDNFNY